MIQHIIQNKDISPEIKNKTKEIIATHYTPWALSQYNKFVNRNRSYLYKKHIPLNDLRQYAIVGMAKALAKYNGSVDFTLYAEKYVLGTLHQGVTDLIPLRPISHSLRMNGKDAPSITFAHENTWMFDKLYKSNSRDNTNIILRSEEKYISRKNEIERINAIVKQFTPYEQQLFYYRYSKDTLHEIRTVANVAELMCCSTETYRKKMNKIIDKIRDEINMV
jgi:RNA polymerase sigma factor (sigma-70 family)